LTFNKYHIRGSPFKVNISEVKTKQEQTSEPEIEEQQITQKLANYQANYDIVTNWNNESTIRSNIDEIRDINNYIEMSGLNNRILTPITDTSEENSDDNMDERIVYRGETFIEDYQRMPDGSAHLLLHIDDTECIDLSNIKGKYKYKLKRIGGLDDFECPHGAAKKISKIDETTKLISETKFDETAKLIPEAKYDETSKLISEAKYDETAKLISDAKFDETIDPLQNPKSTVSAAIQKFQDAAKANNTFIPSNVGDLKKTPKTSSAIDEVLNTPEIIKSHQEPISGISNQKKEFSSNEQLTKQPTKSKSEQSFDKDEPEEHKKQKDYQQKQTQNYEKNPEQVYEKKQAQDNEIKQKKSKYDGENEGITNPQTRRKSSGSNEVERDISSVKPLLAKKQILIDEKPFIEKRESDLNLNKGDKDSNFTDETVINPTTNTKPFEPVAANVSEKRNFFENAAANVKNTSQTNKPKTKGDETVSIPRQSSKDRAEAEKNKDKSGKSDSKKEKGLAKDFGKQKTDSFEKSEPNKNELFKDDSLSRSESQKSKGSSKKNSENDKDKSKSDDDDDDDEVINVFNEKIVTKHIRQLQKTVDEETTVVKDEKFVITPVDSKIDVVDSKSPVPDSITNVIHQNEDIKSYIDRKTTIVNETSAKNKPTRIEILTQKLRTEPILTNSQQMEHLVEKFKPEESITYLYEYDQVIENSDSETNKGDRTVTVVDQVTTKTTKKQNTEVSQTVEPIIPRHEKKITSSTTTYVTQEEKDKVTESLEKMVVDSNEYSYKQIKGTLEEDEAVDIHEPNLNTLTEYLMSSNINEEPIESSTTVSVTTSATCGIGFTKEDLNDDDKSVIKIDSTFIESKISSKNPSEVVQKDMKEYETDTPTLKPKVKDLSDSHEKAIDDEYEELTKKNLDDIMKDTDDHAFSKNKKFDDELEDKPNKDSGFRKKSESLENKDRKKKNEDIEENEIKQRKKSDDKTPTIGKTIKIQKGASSFDDEEKTSIKGKKDEARKISDKKINQVEDLTDARIRLRKTSTPKIEEKIGGEHIGEVKSEVEIKSEDKIPIRDIRPHTRSIDSIPENKTKDSTDDNQISTGSSDIISKPKIEKISKSKLVIFEPKKDDIKFDSIEKQEKSEKVIDKSDKNKSDSKQQLKEKVNKADSLDDQTSERIKRYEKNINDSANFEAPIKSKSKLNPIKSEKLNIDDDNEQMIESSSKKRAEDEETRDNESIYSKDKTKKIEY